MATVEQLVYVNSSHAVAKISVDPLQIRGDGGPIRPTIVVPLAVSMLGHGDSDHHIAVTRLRARLCSDQNAFPNSAVCAPVDEDVFNNTPLLSQKQAQTHAYVVNLRFELTLPELAALEARRHLQPQQRDLPLYLGLDPEVAGLQTGGNNDQSPWAALGWHSFAARFWYVMVYTLPVQIPRETWVNDVLPGLGYDQVRLVEVRLPPSLPELPTAGSTFDSARRALDERRYDDCMIALRGLVAMWNAMLGATKAEPLAQIIARRHGWSADDPRITFIDSTWRSVIDLVNLPHHPEGQATALSFDGGTARVAFHMVVALSEFVGAM